MIRRFAISFFLVVLTSVLGAACSSADDTLQFNRDIRPLLSENCFHCHGPDEGKRAADLRLDTEDGAKDWAILEGDAEASEVVTRIFSDDPDAMMPPPDSERSLNEHQKQLIRNWIDQGAAYQKHWSFEPVQAIHPPQVSSDWARDPIDRFIAKPLEEKSLLPAALADRETLLRRITFDLTGVPPTVDEIDRFLADSSGNAVERAIDRLMADPRFGERMASDWLDVARYSDTYGYQVDRDRFVWPWRDWVINAFNRNLPYDEFVKQQVAGDLIPGANRDMVLATTFNRLHPQKVEGGSVPEEFRIEYVADRTQTVGTAFLGLTMECCRCHSHKYDPITQSEYYELSAFFDNIDEAGLYSYFTTSIPTPTLPLPNEAQERQIKSLTQKIAELKSQVQQSQTRRIEPASIIDQIRTTPENFFATPIETVDFENEESAKAPNRLVEGHAGQAVLLSGDDPVDLKQGNFRREQPFSVSLWIKAPQRMERAVVFHRSRAWTDAASRGYQLLIEDGKLSWSLIHFWPGNAMRIQTQQAIPVNQWVHVVVTNDGSSLASGLSMAVNGRKAEVEIVRDNLTRNITGGGGDHIAIGQRFRDRGFRGGSVDSMRVFDVKLTELEIQRLASDESLTWLDKPNEWTQRQLAAVVDHWSVRHDESTAKLRNELAMARKQLGDVQNQLDEIMVMRETPEPRQTHRLDRGAYDSPAESVQPATPRAIFALGDDRQRNRLGLAQWMVDPANPLTSRVAVNRLWQMCFGTGLVRTPEDLGSQGEPPTHPELLDWLANDFVQSGWDTKRMIKQIMLSKTYQRSSDRVAEGREPSGDAEPDGLRLTAKSAWQMDPQNRLLARHNAYRLPAEMLRDQSLMVSGQMVSTIGGAPVRPYEVEASFKPTKRDTGEGLYRRSIYTYWKRTGPAPAMMTLDAAKRDVCRVRRERTASPLQAFVLLNGPQYVEAARGLAATLMRQQGEPSDLVLRNAFRSLTSRQPTDAELAVVVDLYEGQKQYFESHRKRADEFLNVGDLEISLPLDSVSFAALTTVCSTLMNFDESVMKR